MASRLVFADDLSECADTAWLWINSHDWPGWRIEVVTAEPGAVGIPEEVVEWRPPHARELLRPGVADGVSHLHSSAKAADALASCDDRDLLVLGPKGRGLLKRLHLGSTSERLMQDPPLPMVIARQGRTTRRAVVCADGSPHSHFAVQAFRALPWSPEVDVLVVSVPQDGFDPQAAAAQAVGWLAGGVRSATAHVPVPDPTRAFYQHADVIVDLLGEWQADLAVLGSRGLAGMSAIRAGSIATVLAGKAPCSVLLARAPSS